MVTKQKVTKKITKRKRKPITPNSQIKAALRLLWLRSRERAAAIKRDDSTCQDCGKKQSKAKGRRVDIEEHHIDGIKWKDMMQYIRDNLLVNPDRLKTLCKECHEKYRETEE
jgi:hypothetical protein